MRGYADSGDLLPIIVGAIVAVALVVLGLVTA